MFMNSPDGLSRKKIKALLATHVHRVNFPVFEINGEFIEYTKQLQTYANFFAEHGLHPFFDFSINKDRTSDIGNYEKCPDTRKTIEYFHFREEKHAILFKMKYGL